MLSLNPICADLVQAEIDDRKTAESLTNGLDICFELLRQLLEYWQSDEFVKSKLMDADAKKHLEKTLKRMSRLQEVLEHDMFGNDRVKSDIGLVTGGLAYDYEAATGREFRYPSAIDSLRNNLPFSNLIIAETLQRYRRGRGGPADENRDFLIGLIEVAFRENARDCN